MRRNNLTFPIQIIRKPNDNPGLDGESSMCDQPYRRALLFMAKKTTLVRASNGSVTAVRHILIFDDHPDSLRLILARRGNREGNHRPAGGARLRTFILPVIAILAALTGMFWPLL